MSKYGVCFDNGMSGKCDVECDDFLDGKCDEASEVLGQAFNSDNYTLEEITEWGELYGI